ncbi:hypothetical protein ACFLWL_01040 [Chloroflexota bacterium]
MSIRLLTSLILISIFIAFFGCIKTPSLVGPTPDCKPAPNKNKVAIVIAKDGIYDTSAISSQILEYYAAVKKDLDIENTGIKKFDSTTISELDIFIDRLYLEENIAYVVLIGDDLPVANVTKDDCRNLHAIYEKLECVNRERCFNACNDLAVSYILPPVFYSSSEKVDFVLQVLETYTGYHDDFAAISTTYQRSALFITTKELAEIEAPFERSDYDLPTTTVYNSEQEKVISELKRKHIILKYGCVHGSATSVGLGISRHGIQTTLEEYTSFIEENGTPALFVQSGSCGGATIKEDNIGYCCWPQIFMESGVWAYYIFGGGGDQIPLMEKAFSKEETIGLAIRKNIVAQNLVFGDILAHMK